MLSPFHIAIPVNDLQKSRYFYGQVFGCQQGRQQVGKWIDFNFFGHQLVCHFTTSQWKPSQYCNYVDKYDVPVPHFGLCLTVEQWKQIKNKLPHLRFQGEPGEQYTMFFKDPTGNNIQIKAMTKPQNLFARYIVKNQKGESK